ncbi:MAG: methyltransferase domain-containing protein, partial [Planctomycetes bacterium]|nr:methyltransferase domain-containing protein [Planctomycetota bacterium]
CRKCDLNRSLPYDDASFDAVVSASGIHRVFAVGRALHEYARVLKPGGTLLMTLPNFTKLSRRLRFLTTGVNSWAVLRLSREVEHPEAHFRQSAGLPQVLSVMKAMGLEVLRLTGQRRKARQLLFLPVLPVIWLGLLLTPAKKRREYCLREAASWPALFSDFVLIEARKPGEAREPGAARP